MRSVWILSRASSRSRTDAGARARSSGAGSRARIASSASTLILAGTLARVAVRRAGRCAGGATCPPREKIGTGCGFSSEPGETTEGRRRDRWPPHALPHRSRSNAPRVSRRAERSRARGVPATGALGRLRRRPSRSASQSGSYGRQSASVRSERINHPSSVPSVHPSPASRTASPSTRLQTSIDNLLITC
jgi:hypothetical protein